ncbi:Aste57867_13633 [Aphanomyces stellatus]|uniref:Aste57867_13633 protein n=1 Tax=Aphanomyces stellatus TaxID=120398 RepID=A0A485KZI3_9STRA|nr:hypothetical protein As57867_013583 [Aphanomyces stellatus]VFT90470.1 Aste57867_13633 [Aphanomyces stellatus]
MDAPHPAAGHAYPDTERRFHGPFFEWFQVDDTVLNVTDATEGRALYARQPCVGIEASLEFLTKRVRAHGPYDVLFGYSQGASMATILAAHYLANERQLPFRAVVLSNGVRAARGIPPSLVAQDGRMCLDVPSIHLIGTQDIWHQSGLELSDCYDPTTRQVFEHDGGHILPTWPQHDEIYHAVADRLRTLVDRKN